MDWIASQYNLSLPSDYFKPATCSISTGDKGAVNNTNCLSQAIDLSDNQSALSQCNFSPKQPRCELYAIDSKARPAYNLNFYYCLNKEGSRAVCANDYPGVDPSAIVVGGEAAIFAVAAAATTAGAGADLLGPLLGAGAGLAGLGLGRIAMMTQGSRSSSRLNSSTCPTGQCRAQSRQCCRIVDSGGRQLCPLRC